MDLNESPPKRRKTSPSNTPPPLATQRDNGSQYETVATLPLHSPDPLSQTPQPQYLTQPTQIIGQSPRKDHVISPEPRKYTVQVAASSPPVPTLPKGGFLASALAPAGTAFRHPGGINAARPVPNPKSKVFDLSSDVEDDGPRYLGGSSDEEDTPARRGNDPEAGRHTKQAEHEHVEDSPIKNGLSKIQEVARKAIYDPSASKLNRSSSLKGSVFDSRNRNGDLGRSTIITPGTKKSSDIMANAYGSVSRPPPTERSQLNRPRMQATSPSDRHSEDMSFDDIMDPQYRIKVKRIRGIFPNKTVAKCYGALLKKKGHFEDAIDYLSTESDKQVDLTMSSEDELQGTTPMVPRQRPVLPVKPVAKAPIKTIREKYSGTAEATKAKPSITENRSMQSTSEVPAKPRKRLVQGRKHDSSPAVESPKKLELVESSESDAADPGLSDTEIATFDERLLKFFNTCSARDLADTASIDIEVAEYIIQKRPFTSLEKIRKIPAKNAAATAKKSRARPIGEKIVDKCEEMLIGYEAVDALVKKCESLGKPLSEEMKNWGVDVFGSTSRSGELDFTRLGGSQHDSGIGTPTSDSDDEFARLIRHGSLLPQPALMSESMKMKDYQLVGFNWLSLLYKQKLSCLLSDDMGLGKTCQVIAFLAHLRSIGERGPHLVVVPSSTLENWLLEFQKFCPQLKVEPLHGSQAERFEIREMMEHTRSEIDVIITTYTIGTSKDDNHFLRKYGFNCAVFDEGHMLKNSKSQQYSKLIRILSRFRLLLTGTPVQNNLQELASLLGFLLPDIFNEKKHDLRAIFEHKVKTNSSNHDALLSKQRIDRARSILTPFILRRQKHQVLKDLPPKSSRVEYCDLTNTQAEIYETERARVKELGIKDNKSANILMKLRQAALHPMLFRRHYKDSMLPKIAKACLKDPQFEQSDPDLIQLEIKEYSDLELYELCEPRPALTKFVLNNDMWMDSGKVIKVVELLQNFKEEGARTLIFSQFRMVLNILEMVLNTIEMPFLRIDGETDVNARQSLIDQFYANHDIPVFMLTTKAGGAGINLAAANKIIIFDSSFNPQDDIQAENRAHRIGQAKEVEVVRLISRGTIEEQIFAVGRTKLALDQKVVGAGEDGTALDAGGNAKMDEDGEEGVKKMEELVLDKLKEETA